MYSILFCTVTNTVKTYFYYLIQLKPMLIFYFFPLPSAKQFKPFIFLCFFFLKPSYFLIVILNLYFFILYPSAEQLIVFLLLFYILLCTLLQNFILLYFIILLLMTCQITLNQLQVSYRVPETSLIRAVFSFRRHSGPV